MEGNYIGYGADYIMPSLDVIMVGYFVFGVDPSLSALCFLSRLAV